MTADLTSSFGEPATSRLRGLLPPRAAGAQRGDARPNDSATPGETTPGETTPGERTSGERTSGERTSGERTSGGTASGGTASGGTASGPTASGSASSGPEVAAAPPAASRRSAARRSSDPAGTTNRRWGRTRVGSREHVDLLVLAALRHGPDDARGVIDRLRSESGGALEAPVRTVHRALHRLTRNRLLAHVAPGPRYRLTPMGERALPARSRQWRSFVRAVDAVVNADVDA